MMSTPEPADQTDGSANPRIDPDLVLALALSVAVLIESGSAGYGSLQPAVLLSTVPLIWRRRYPLVVFGVTVMGAVISNSAPFVGLTSIVIAAYSVSVYSNDVLFALFVLIGTAIAVVMRYGDSAMPSIPRSYGPFLLLLPVWLVGQQVRARQVRAEASENKAMRLEREQDAATRAAIAEERGRVARELHDVVAHSVSVMLVQAGAARHVLATAPDQAREALLAVESSGREAMAELRHLVGVLHEDDAGVALAPQPGADGIEPLIKRVREAGLPVTLWIEGEPFPLSPGLNLALYRIVQEALTNTLKYSGMAKTEVVLEYREAELKVEILDEGTGTAPSDGAPQGRGLLGMQERVALYGGTFEAGPRLTRGFAVRAWLPLAGSAA